MNDLATLSSLERLLLGIDTPHLEQKRYAPLRKGEICPMCGEGKLDYNGLLQLECPSCGYVSGEGGGCT
jgi:rubredoxin